MNGCYARESSVWLQNVRRQHALNTAFLCGCHFMASVQALASGTDKHQGMAGRALLRVDMTLEAAAALWQ